MGNTDLHPPSAERIGMWRQNIRNSNFANYYLNMGVAVSHQGQPEQAISFLKQGRAYPAYEEEMMVAMVDALRASGNMAEADRILAEELARNPQAELNGCAGLCQIYAATVTIAPNVTLAQFDRALELARTHGATDKQLALFLRRLAFEIRARLNPTPEVAVRQALAQDFDALDHIEASVEAFADLIRELNGFTRLTPAEVFDAWCRLLRLATRVEPAKRPDVAISMAPLSTVLQDPAMASRIPELVILVKPLADDSVTVRKMLEDLGTLAFHHNRDSMVAAEIFLDLLEYKPEDTDLRLLAARCLAMANRFDLASVHLHKAAAQTPTPDQWGAIATLAVAVGEAEEAMVMASSAVRSDSQSLKARWAFGLALQAKARDEEALRMFEALRSEHPNDTRMIVSYASQLMIAGRIDDAILILDAGIGLRTPPDPYPLLWKGMILVRTGDADRGRALADRAIGQLGLPNCCLHLRTFPRAVRAFQKELEMCGIPISRIAGAP